MNLYHHTKMKDLFAKTLSEKPDSYIVGELFERYPSLVSLMNVTENELIEIKGIGKAKACQIVATLKLAQQLNRPMQDEPYIIRSPQDVFTLLHAEMKYLQQEHFVVILLNTKNHVIEQPKTISIGTLNSALVHPREVFRAAVKQSSASLVCVHNHPSGDTTPSKEDIEITKRLIEAGRIIGIEVLDHVIIGDNRFVSLKESGLM